jgi:hypothetical protein
MLLVRQVDIDGADVWPALRQPSMVRFVVALAILYAASIAAEFVAGLPDPVIFGLQLVAVVLVGVAWYLWTRYRRVVTEPDRASS